jgi:hypothetical protein
MPKKKQATDSNAPVAAPKANESTVEIGGHEYVVGGDRAAYSHDGGTEIVKGYKPPHPLEFNYHVVADDLRSMLPLMEAENCQVAEHAKSVIAGLDRLHAALESYHEARKTQC